MLIIVLSDDGSLVVSCSLGQSFSEVDSESRTLSLKFSNNGKIRL